MVKFERYSLPIFSVPEIFKFGNVDVPVVEVAWIYPTAGEEVDVTALFPFPTTNIFKGRIVLPVPPCETIRVAARAVPPPMRSTNPIMNAEMYFLIS